jgi:23S rRNA (cytosine1962-C5)-methyltransferase
MGSLRVQVDEPAAAALRRGRPWVFREAVREPIGKESGAVVEVVDRRGAFLGRGLLDPGAPVAVRILTRDPGEAFGRKLLMRRLRAALELRRRVLDLNEIGAWRLCNGEGDQLSGLAVDLYNDYAVVELSTMAWAPHRELLTAALGEVFPVRGVVEKSRLKPGRDGEVIQQLAGAVPPEELVVREGPAAFAVALAGTSKSGLFLDQRETRESLRRLTHTAEVLNVFCYTGALSVASAQGGARRVVSVDLSRPALARARRNFELNGLDPGAHEWIQGDAFEELPSLHLAGRRFDLVILDPPAFATSKKRVFQAERDWRELAALGARLLRSQGVLVASSPMAALSFSALERALADGGAQVGAYLRVFSVRSQPPDFPVDPACPERRHLKVLFAYRA